MTRRLPPGLPAPPTLVPTATTSLAVPVVESFAQIEADYGSRDQLITILAFAPRDDHLDYILNLVADLDLQDTSLADTCARGGVRPSELLHYLRAGNVLYAQARASRHLPAHLDQTVEHTLVQSHRHEDVCDVCQGRPADPPCTACQGTGVKTYPADPVARKLALELGGLLSSKSPFAINIGVQQLVEQGPGEGRLERVQAAIAATAED